jgi:flagellar protein FliO/FliZ
MIKNTDPLLFAAGLRMFWGLLVVLGILLIMYALMRKKLSFIKRNDNSRIKVIEIRHLMPKKSLCLVKIGDQEFLLGLGNDTIKLIAEINVCEKENFPETLASVEEQNAQAI